MAERGKPPGTVSYLSPCAVTAPVDAEEGVETGPALAKAGRHARPGLFGLAVYTDGTTGRDVATQRGTVRKHDGNVSR